jgi:hypothetical protein
MLLTTETIRNQLTTESPINQPASKNNKQQQQKKIKTTASMMINMVELSLLCSSIGVKSSFDIFSSYAISD